MTILQSEDQGKLVWPNGGYEKLLAASMWWIYAGGNASASFYRNVSDLIGDYEYTERSTSAGRGGGSTQVSRRTERIMDVADLDALSVGRMIVFASGCRPALVRARPWFTAKRLRQLVAMRPDRVHHQAEEDVHVSETTEDSFVVDELAIAAAAMDVAAAEKALHSAEEKAAAADDALADANDDVTVAEAKVDDYTSDDAKLPWQVAAAHRELAKKTRAQARAARPHEEAHHELTPAQRKLDVALETLDAAKSTPVTEDDEDESSISLLAWSVPLTTAPPELVEWVEGTFQDYLTGTVGLVKSGRWCSRWTEHPDAVHRLAGIYDEWTLMRLRIKGAPSLHTFYREILDYHIPQLTSREDGVFQRCDGAGHEPHERMDTD